MNNKRKRHSSHFLTKATLSNNVRSFHLVILPDGRRGHMYVVGVLDANDGMFYEDKGGTIGKVQDVDGCWIAYVPLRLLKISLFASGIVFK